MRLVKKNREENKAMVLVKMLNNYFFDSDSITISDALFFYGILSVIVITGIVSVSI